MFEKAARQKLRFETSIGNLSAEDLWELPLLSKTGKVHLDELAKNLFKQLKENECVSFVTKEDSVNDTIQLKFDIVKHIIDVKLEEKKAEENLKLNKEKKQQILSIIAQKENENLASTSIDDLRKLAESL